MRKAVRGFLFAMVLVVAVPAALMAQSGELPNDLAPNAGCPAATSGDTAAHNMPIVASDKRYLMVMKYTKPGGVQVYFNTTGTGALATASGDAGTQVHQTTCALGGEVNDRILRDICIKAVDSGYTVTPSWPFTAPVDTVADCTPAAGVATDSLAVSDPPCGFTVTESLLGGTIPRLAYAMTGAATCAMASFFENTTGGNTLSVDMLPNYVLQVQPANATVHVEVFHTQGGANPRTFDVATTSGQTEATIAGNFTAGFLGTGLSLSASTVASARLVAKTNKSINSPVINDVDSVFRDFPVTHITGLGASGVTRITVRGGIDQRVMQETNDPSADVPALSTWGMVLVVGLLLLSGYWLLQRRRRAVPVS